MILKLILFGRHNLSSCDPERADHPEQKEDDLDAADDGESTEEPHGASDEAQLGLCLDLLVSLNVVEGGGLKVDLHQLKCGKRSLHP